MARILVAPLAPGMALQPGYTVKLLAVDPTDGSAVSGVSVSNVSMQVNVADQDDNENVPIVKPFYTYT